jgi:hypothetical protein
MRRLSVEPMRSPGPDDGDELMLPYNAVERILKYSMTAWPAEELSDEQDDAECEHLDRAAVQRSTYAALTLSRTLQVSEREHGMVSSKSNRQLASVSAAATRSQVHVLCTISYHRQRLPPTV